MIQRMAMRMVSQSRVESATPSMIAAATCRRRWVQALTACVRSLYCSLLPKVMMVILSRFYREVINTKIVRHMVTPRPYRLDSRSACFAALHPKGLYH